MFPFWSDHSLDYYSSNKKKSKTTRMPMGEKEGCDDGKRNLELDLGDIEEATTCYTGVDPGFYTNFYKCSGKKVWKFTHQE